MSTNVLMIITVITVVVCVLGLSLGLFPLLKKKGVNTDKILDTASDITSKAGTIIDALDELMPNNKAIDILQIIDKWAKIAAGHAEQLSHSGQLDAVQRKQTAKDTVYAVLKQLNIELTDDLKKLVDAAIENAVNELGHVPADIKVQQVPSSDAAVQLSKESTIQWNTEQDN